jgi:GTP-binding protein
MAHPLDAAKYLRSETNPSVLGACAAEVTFVGRSNVGKSSLINAVCRNDIARVSATPGRTRTLNVYLTPQDRWIVDLPGYGYAAGPDADRAAWLTMISTYLTQRASLRMIFSLVDAKVGATRLDVEMQEWLREAGLPYRIVATKADQVKPSRSAAQRRAIAQSLGLDAGDIAWVSAKKGLGIAELRAEISTVLGF